MSALGHEQICPRFGEPRPSAVDDVGNDETFRVKVSRATDDGEHWQTTGSTRKKE
jgi:hypothetical protein